MLTSTTPSTYTLRYAAGIVCRRVDVGVIGERKERMISTSLVFDCDFGARIEYVRFVVEASYLAPSYVAFAMV
jgi:hypothetical protein